jgi:hypothetical protein
LFHFADAVNQAKCPKRSIPVHAHLKMAAGSAAWRSCHQAPIALPLLGVILRRRARWAVCGPFHESQASAALQLLA